jgi:micrococcal nuclease
MRSLLTILLSLGSAFAGDSYAARVSRIIDGDTVVVERSSGQLTKIRLLGIDSPETDQEGGAAATQFTASITADRMVEVLEHYTDRYRRTVAEIILPDGRLLSHALVASGHAWWWPRYAPHDTELEQAEAEARDSRLGLWAGPNPIAPWEWRKARAATARLSRAGSRRCDTFQGNEQD